MVPMILCIFTALFYFCPSPNLHLSRSLSLKHTHTSLSPPCPLKAHKCVRIPHSSTDNEIFDELALPNRALIFTGSGMIQSAQDVNNSCI